VTRSFEEKPHESDALFAHEELRTISIYFIEFLHSRDVASKFDCVFYGVALGVIIEVGENVLATGELLFDPSGWAVNPIDDCETPNVFRCPYLTQRWLQALYFGHKRQRLTGADACEPLDTATISTNEKFRASGHHTSFSFS